MNYITKKNSTRDKSVVNYTETLSCKSYVRYVPISATNVHNVTVNSVGFVLYDQNVCSMCIRVLFVLRNLQLL